MLRLAYVPTNEITEQMLYEGQLILVVVGKGVINSQTSVYVSVGRQHRIRDTHLTNGCKTLIFGLFPIQNKKKKVENGTVIAQSV
jgi:hypothetical protein